MKIAVALRNLIDDCKYWIDHDTYAADEIAVRFKHRIVQIHCFSNGNGRHSRLMGDLNVKNIFNRPVFTWGSMADFTKTGGTREAYLTAIKAADANDIIPLLKFSRQ